MVEKGAKTKSGRVASLESIAIYSRQGFLNFAFESTLLVKSNLLAKTLILRIGCS